MCVARAVDERTMMNNGKSSNFKYFLIEIVTMKDDKFWAKVREWQKDPEFRKAAKEFVKRTTS